MTRDQMMDRTKVTQPQRPSVPTFQVALGFCHVHEIVVMDSDFVPVRRFRPKADGAYEYFGDIEMVSCMPGFKSFEYRPFSYLADAWSADGNTRMLWNVFGRWYCDLPAIGMMSSDMMTEISQNFPIVDARPSALATS